MKSKTSISHLTGKEQKVLRNIKKKLIERLPPLLIFCFNSHSTQSVSRSDFITQTSVEDWEFSCSLLIILPDGATIDNETKKEIQDQVAPFGKVNVFIHRLNFMRQKLEDSNLFFTWVQHNAILLYNKDNSWQLLPTVIKKQAYKEQAKEYFLQNPNFENYLDVKITPLGHMSTDNKKQPEIKKVPIDLPENRHGSPGHIFAQNLSPEQIVNPYLVINYFFRDYSLQDAKKHINGWMTGLYEKVNWIKKRPSDLIYFTERCFQLIEAGWLLSQKDNRNRLANLSLQYKPDEIDFMDPNLYCAAQFKASCWSYFPRFLNKKEFINPYKVFSKFFKFQSLEEWKTQLQNVFYLTLSGFDVDHTGETINTLGFTKRLNKFVEACQLINIREFEWSDGKLMLKINNGSPNE